MPITAEDYLLEKKKYILQMYSSQDVNSISFVGIDRSLTSTGWAVVKAGKYINGGEIKPKMYGVERLIYIGQEVLKIIPKDNPLIIMEGYAFSAQGRSMFSLGECGGILKGFIFLKKMQSLEVAPHLVKKYICGAGNCEKNLVPMFVNKKFGITPIGNDHADSLAISMLGYHAFNYKAGKGKYTQTEIECFNTFFNLEKKKKKSKNKTTRQLALEINE